MKTWKLSKSRKKFVGFFSLLLVLGTSIGFVFPAFAAQSFLGVDAVLPENQYEQGHSYFDLKLAPKQQQVLKVKLSNSATSPIRVKIRIDRSATNAAGHAEVVASKGIKRDSTLKYSMADLVKYEKEVEIPASSSIDYTFTITAPAKKFKGMIAGGVSFQEEPMAGGADEEKNRVSIDQVFSHAIQIILHGEPDRVESKLELTNVSAKLENDSKVIISGALHNLTPNFITNMNTTVKLYAKNDTKKKTILYKQESDNLKMAPNSGFDYQLSLGGIDGEKTLKPGEYRWVQEVESTHGNWKFEKEFVIPKSKAEELEIQAKKKAEKEQQEIKRQARRNFLGKFFLVFGILIVVGLVGFFSWKKYTTAKKELDTLKKKLK